MKRINVIVVRPESEGPEFKGEMTMKREDRIFSAIGFKIEIVSNDMIIQKNSEIICRNVAIGQPSHNKEQ